MTVPLRVVAIDGGMGAGKSTVARAVAEASGLDYLDTGAMYRGVGWAALTRDVSLDPLEGDTVVKLAEALEIDVGARVVVDGVDVTTAIRTPEVARAASIVATVAGVRRAMVDQQRAWTRRRGGGVLEGRDIATVVFPDAPVKVYLTASVEERARRRHAEVSGQTIDEVLADVHWRDHNDSTREIDPLQVAAGATVLDTTGLSVDEVVARIVTMIDAARA